MKIINYVSVMILLSTAIHAEVKLTIKHEGIPATYVLSDKSGKEIDKKENVANDITLVAPEPGNYDLTMANDKLTRTKEMALTKDKTTSIRFALQRRGTGEYIITEQD